MQRYKELEQANLGLEHDGSVRLLPHNLLWRRCFSKEAHRIYEALKIENLKLYHIGSTSIPSIKAKPIIDILGSVRRLEDLDEKQEALKQIGYEYKGEYGINGRRYSVLYNPEKTKGYIHLHIFEDNHTELQKHLLFRDYLRANSTQAKKYEKLKLELVEVNTPRGEYTNKKGKLIAELDTEASSWKTSYRPKAIVIIGSSEGGSNTLGFVQKLLPESDSIEHVLLKDLHLDHFKYDVNYTENDQFLSVVETMLKADNIILATPVHWYSLSSHMKVFFDRLSDLILAQKEFGKALYGKKIELVVTGSDKDPPVGFDVPVNLTALYFGMDYVGMKYKCIQ